ncbi:phosphate/phosphite/phosphonate ABC transporter substrate-binding protein [Sporolactobacillus shoreicorticis]|uniref:Phosphate/phosphite/phosphonate ABC transporter substrate-binding protein n=1 Tax=Sporolactobacillus shoreicorticis TaxID=1923877 RepID=A0ABW5RZU8_9BACL|nr:phosphate/phosphite/phosphonate ABC transporter substrate-binding protein [Sporolactobacillus shoreicorticis]MCO7125062.1 phosphate/phosphite/phosphonate ABC transporter substrate-binding protein [Sporolactobacillus shoreicorticis]
MNKLTKKITAVFALFILVLSGCSAQSNSPSKSAAQSQNTNEPSKIRFVDTGAEGMEELKREFGPFKEALSKATNKKVDFFSISSRTAASTAMEFNQVDLVLAGGGDYVTMQAKSDVKPVVAITRPGYRSVIIVKADSKIKSVEDLKGKNVAMKDIGSLSGHIGPINMLQEHGLDINKDVKLLMLGETFVEAFKAGETDALASAKTRYDELVEKEGKGKYRILEESEDLPNDLFVASAKLSDSYITKLKKQMLDNQEKLLKSMLITGEHDIYKQSKLIDVVDSDYDSVRSTFKALGMDVKS